MSFKLSELCGYIGMVLVHAATLPTTILALVNGHASVDLPPFNMILILDIGLILFFIRAAAERDILYMLSNGVGVFFQTIMLGIIVYANIHI